MATASDVQIARAAAAAGWSGHDLDVAVAVAIAESRGVTTAANPPLAKPPMPGAYGVWQVLYQAHPELFRAYHWNDLNDNAKMGHAVYAKAGHKFTPWVQYTTGVYLMFMPRARRGTAHMGSDSATPTQTAHATDASLTGAASGLGSLLDFAQFIANPHNWQRLALFSAGGALVVLALMRWTGTDVYVAKAAKTAASTAAKAAVMA